MMMEKWRSEASSDAERRVRSRTRRSRTLRNRTLRNRTLRNRTLRNRLHVSMLASHF
jgi:hypothetical protein